ncbi:MAG: flavin reductase family protein [Akkermansiaceae bacterium]
MKVKTLYPTPKMTFDLETLPASTRYKLLASLVMPRPIAWVTTIDENGTLNAAPFSFFNVFGSNPPIVAFAPGNKDRDTPKDTARNIRRNQEFVVHMVDEPLGQAMVDTSATLPHGTSELDALNLTTLPSEKVSVPRIAEAPVALECTEHSTLEIGTNRLVIGIAHFIHSREGLFDDNHHLNPGIYHPVGRMASPDWYTRTSDQFEIPRPD